MPNRSKEKGNRFERYIVSLCEQADIPAKRSWGSDGRSLGLHEEVDLVIDSDIRVQAKCRRRLPAYIMPSPNVDNAIRKATHPRTGEKEIFYLHPSKTPIDEIDFDDGQLELFEGFDCEGYCGL